MTDPKKIFRKTLFSIHPLSYRIKITELSKEGMTKKLFIEVMKQMRQIEERKDFMAEEIGMDMTAYEDQFFAVIENLMKMTFNKEQCALIQMYLYQLVPDKEWDGTITIEKDKKDQTLPFRTPDNVWEVINIFNE